MKLDSKYYSYCQEVGLMKENYSREGGLKSIKEALAKEKSADPAFVEAVQKLTLSSPEIHFRVCIIYQYSAEVEYVRGGVINDKHISDIGTIGIPDYLHAPEYKGKGEYTTVTDMNSVPYQYWNDDNLLTLDRMKSVLTKTIEDELPSGTQSFRSKDWKVSAYLVPILSVEMPYKGKTYYLSYNLQNGYYHWAWPDHPVLLKRGKEAKSYTLLLRVGAVLLSILGLIFGLSGEGALGIVVPLAVGVINIIVWKKSKKNGKYFDRFFLKNPDTTLVSQLIPAFVALAFGFISMIIGLAA